MSAIFGIINKKGEDLEPSLVKKIQDSLLHRAVDGQGIFIYKNIMLGHHKLNVHQRQKFESQPSTLNNLVITCDARLDNFYELKQKLVLTENNSILTDDLIILESYKKWGFDCVKHFEGEFCFTIWDKKNKILYGATDHVGFRTFYFYENKDFFAFSSQINSLEVIKNEPLIINDNIFINHYTNIKHPITYDVNIQVLPSGHYISINNECNATIKQYWTPKKENRVKEEIDWASKVFDITSRKIASMIDSDYPIGVLLSGGLDSSFITSIACEKLKKENKKLYAFCSVLPEEYEGLDKDERHYIKILEEQFDNLEVHYVTIPEHIGPYSNLVHAFERTEAPVNIFHYVDDILAEYARKFNVRTLLTGYGGDLTISYNGNGTVYKYIKKLNLLKATRLFIDCYKNSSLNLIRSFLNEVIVHNGIFKIFYRKFILKNEFSFLLNKKIIKRLDKIENNYSIEYKILLQRSITNGEIGADLLEIRKQVNSFQLERLSPLLCKDLLELCLAVPNKHFILNGIKRNLIRKASKDIVPIEILNRKDKMPYSPDFYFRFKNIDKSYIAKILEAHPDLSNHTGIKKEDLKIEIQKIDNRSIHSEMKITSNIFYIPFVIIAAEFYI